MKSFITVIVALIVIVFHIWASRRSPRYWYVGGIIPLLWVGVLAFLFINGQIDFKEDLRVIVFPTLIFLLIWLEGHQSAKKKEMGKMKSQDIDI